jgi:4-amino-4-deoxy-L-arabinose transferase-like glycosyltransferase
MGSAFRHPAWTIFLVAFLLRVGVVLFLGHLVPEGSDKVERYDPIAFDLMNGHGFSMGGAPTAISGPVYPALLAMLYTLFGQSTTVVRIFFSALDAAHCVVFYLIAQKTFGHRIAVLTALVLIVFPLTFYCILLLSPEVAFLLPHALFILAFVVAVETRMPRYFFLSGLALGVATLARAVPILLPLAALPAFLLTADRRRRGLVHFAVFLVGFAVLVGPWMVRNYVVFQRFIPVQTLGGAHLYMATPARSSSEAERQERAELERMKHVEQDKALYTRSWQRVVENPGEFLRLMRQRSLEMWYRTDSRRFEQPLWYANSVMLVLAAIGMVLSRTMWRTHSLFYLVIAYYVVLHTILVAILRYSLPIIPLVIMFALVPISRLASTAAERGAVKRMIALVRS